MNRNAVIFALAYAFYFEGAGRRSD